MPKLQFGEDAYRIVGDNGEEGELVEYGLAATLQVGLHRYLAVVADDNGEQISLLPDGEWVVDGVAVQVEQEDVVFKGPGEGDAAGPASATGEPEVEEDEEVDIEDLGEDDDADDDDDDLDDEDEDEDEDLDDDDLGDEDEEIEGDGRVNNKHARLLLATV